MSSSTSCQIKCLSHGFHRQKRNTSSQTKINREKLLIIFANIFRNVKNNETTLSVMQTYPCRFKRVQSAVS